MTRLPPISSFLTPPEPKLLEDFDKAPEGPASFASVPAKFTMGATKQPGQLTRMAQPISPPVSPQVALQNKPGLEPSEQPHSTSPVPDPLLFPEHTQTGSSSITTLFPSSTDEVLRHGIREHIARRDAPSKSGDPRHSRRLVMPTEEEYLRFVSGVSQINSIYNRNPFAYRKAVMAQNAEHYRLSKGLKSIKSAAATVNASNVKPLATTKTPKMSRVSSGGKVQKTAVPKRPQARRSTVLSTSASVKGSIPDEKTLPKKKTEDVDFDALPDLSPPASTLDDGRRLRTDWTATPLDLSQDPHQHLLHNAEVALASALRLSCATYLCSKRRIFLARVNNLNRGKEFRKTDAQQACKIDVNKASRLWMAYDSVGWLDQEHFVQYRGKNFE